MPTASFKNMDVYALLELRKEVERTLTDRRGDLQRQIALLGAGRKRPGRPAGTAGRRSPLRGVKVPPKYRGPGGETWAGRGAQPKWMTALLKEGHSIDEFSIGFKRRKAAAASAERPVAKKVRKIARKRAG